jgi:hypothetical protein
MFTEPDPKRPKYTIYKARLKNQVVPNGIAEILGDIVDNFRAALDHAVYAVALAAGRLPPNKILEVYFPISRCADDFERVLKGRCRDVPEEIYPLLRSFEPYKGASDAIYALNLVCVSNKHKLVVPCASATLNAGVNVSCFGFMETPYPAPVWNSEKNEMVLFTISPDTTNVNAQFGFAIHVAFGQIDFVGGKPIGPILDQFSDVAETIVSEIEAETRRLGFTADL